jgi:pimeloyl-ACP methyl ester carboxylesterase
VTPGNELLESWSRRGRRTEVFGRRVFHLEVGEGEPLLVLHGFPSFSLDFHRVLEPLAAHHRVVVHDHLGFGLSDKPRGYSYSLLEQAETAVGLWRSLGVRSGHLLAHDYGTSVATELLARRERGLLPIELRSVTLSNGSVHLELASLRPAQRLLRSRLVGPLFARLVNGWYFRRAMRKLWGDPSRAGEADLDALWQGVHRDDGRLRTPQISSYLDERIRFRHRWIGALTRLDLPTHVLWGDRDPVAVAAIAEQLAAEVPGAELTWLEGVGHYPMLEAPERFAEAVLGFLGRLPAD